MSGPLQMIILMASKMMHCGLRALSYGFAAGLIVLVACKEKPVEIATGPLPSAPLEQVGGLISYRQGNLPVGLSGDRVLIRLDDSLSQTAQYIDGTCSYSFGNIAPGPHRFRVSSASTLPIDTVIVVDHRSVCGTTSSSNYNFVITVGLTNQGRDLLLPQGPGTTWTFTYAYHFSSAPTGSASATSGTHTWQILSRVSAPTKTTLQIQDVRNDSVHETTVLRDTTWQRLDTIYFSMVITPDSISFGAPEVNPPYRDLPRFCLQSSDTLTFRWPEGPPTQSEATYVRGVGVSHYLWSSGGNTRYSQSLDLVDFHAM